MTTNQEWLLSLTLEEYLKWMESEHSEPNPDCSAMLYKMFTENMKHEPCKDYEPKDDASGYGADFNIVEPNFDNLKAVEMDASRFEAVEMDASRLVHHEPDSREKLEADIREWWRVGLPGIQEKAENVINYNEAIKWLDRQAAISERECIRYHESLAQRMIRDGYEYEIWELEKRVKELTVERDELKKFNEYQRDDSSGDRARA